MTNKKERGITIIALVITIIIMLILAAISLNAVLKKDGVVSEEEKAKLEMEIAEEKEKITNKQ